MTVATVRAVAGFYGLSLDDSRVYKLAMLASDAVQPIGSGGDIAASAVTGWVDYASPDRVWLRRARQRAQARGGTGDLLESDWPGLCLRRLPVPSVRLQVGWTGAPASTPALVADVQTRSHGADDYTVFLRDSQDCLARLITAIEDDDAARIMRQIARNRALLAGLSRIGGWRGRCRRRGSDRVRRGRAGRHGGHRSGSGLDGTGRRRRRPTVLSRGF